ncbi:beta-1,4 N-acetylgalactosaminyltransferase 1-like [Branchiostoma lanceolatum]|uniref:beta-1,4 N-acetylgalactosaminyltransferase 1-like n=1 Tax=Branchiostoma lanceolatum TaxID=7740 RepID=UPI003456530B
MLKKVCLCLGFALVNVTLYLMVSDSTHSAEGASRWKKQLTKEDIPVTWINETARLLDPGPCVCEEKSLSFTKAMAKDEKEDLKKRRKKELEKFRDRVSRMSDPLLLVRGHCPLSYPTMGLQVVPGEAIGIPVNFRYLDHDVTIPIRINFRPVPLLYDPGSGKARVGVSCWLL